MDRHSKNNDILLYRNKIKLAPFSDDSLTYISIRPDNDIANKVKYNEQLRVNNFIGDQNLNSNLGYINQPIKIRNILESDRQYLFQGLGKIVTKQLRDYIWQMLKWRIQDVKNKKIPYISWN